MKIGSVVAMAAVVLSGSMLAVSRGRGAPDFSALPAVAQSTPAAVAFTNVNLVPMDSERILRDQTVLVEQGRIRRLGSADEVRVPADVTTVDGSGKYLMPGLAKMHGHMPGGRSGGDGDVLPQSSKYNTLWPGLWQTVVSAVTPESSFRCTERRPDRCQV